MVKGQVFPTHSMKAYQWSGGITQLILSLGTVYVSGQPYVLAALPLGKEPMYPLSRRVSGTQSQFGHF